jgi:hypothetical protein
LLSTFLFTSCRKEVYKQDADFPDLPAYSEKGLGVGGCFINDTAWLMPRHFLSRIHNLYIISYPAADSVVLFFNGQYKEDSLQYKPPSTLFVVLKNIHINSDTGLLALRNRTFELDGAVNYGGFARAFDIERPRNVTGSIRFGNVQQQLNVVYGDGSPDNPKRNPYILAGRFEVDIEADRKYTFTHGRFDMTVLKNTQFYIIP